MYDETCATYELEARINGFAVTLQGIKNGEYILFCFDNKTCAEKWFDIFRDLSKQYIKAFAKNKELIFEEEQLWPTFKQAKRACIEMICDYDMQKNVHVEQFDNYDILIYQNDVNFYELFNKLPICFDTCF